jgi:hypothetical protein
VRLSLLPLRLCYRAKVADGPTSILTTSSRIALGILSFLDSMSGDADQRHAGSSPRCRRRVVKAVPRP